MKRFDRIVSWIVKITTAVGCAAMILMMSVAVFNVISRSFGRPFIGTYEAVTLLVVVMASFSICYAAQENIHVKMDVITERLSKSTQRILLIITTVLSLGIWVAIAWYGALFVRDKFSAGESTLIMEWPMVPFRFILVLGAVLVCVIMFSTIVKAIREAAEK